MAGSQVAPGAPGGQSHRLGWRRAAWLPCVIILSVGYLCIFWRIFSQYDSYRIVGLSDMWSLSLPYQTLLDNRIHHGEFPLWNPLLFCGTPYAADPESMAFYPFNLLRSLLTISPTPFKTDIGWILLVFLHMQIAGLGMLYLARRHRLSATAAYVAVIAFVWSASFTSYSFFWVYFIPDFAWLPWLLLLLNKAINADNGRQRTRYAIGAGLVHALIMLGGFPVFIVYDSLLAAAYATWITLFPSQRRDAGCDTAVPPWPRRVSAGAFTLALCFGLGGLSGAAPLLAGSQFAALSFRSTPVKDPLVEFLKSLMKYRSPRGVLEMFFVYPGRFPNVAIGLSASGACVSMMALISALHPNRRQVIGLAVLTYCLVDVILGPPMPLATLLNHCVPYGLAAQENGLATPLLALPLGLLAGYGVDGARRSSTSPGKRVGRSLAYLAVGAVAFESLARWTARIPYANRVAWLKHPYGFLIFAAAPVALAVLLVCSVWWRRGRQSLILVPALVGMEILSWNTIIIHANFDKRPGDRLSTLYPFSVESLHTAGALWSNKYRIARSALNAPMLKLEPAINGYNPIYLRSTGHVLYSPQSEGAYTRYLRPAMSATNLRWYQLLKRQFWLSRQVVIGPLPPKDTLYPVATTAFLANPPKNLPVPFTTRQKLELSTVSMPAQETTILDQPALSRLSPSRSVDKQGHVTLTFALPTFRLPPLHSALRLQLNSTCPAQARVTARDPTSGETLFLRDFPVHATTRAPDTVQIPLPDIPVVADPVLRVHMVDHDGVANLAGLSVLSDRSDEDRLIRVLRRSANSVEIAVGRLPGSRILTFVDAAYPGWRAYVDSKPAPIYLADDAFKAVILTPGSHTVRFEFSPTRVYLGIAISIAAIAGGMIALMFTYIQFSNTKGRLGHTNA